MTKITDLQTLMANKATKPSNENNPIVAHKLTADPCVLVYGDTVYVYGTNDSQQAEFTKGKQDNGYNKINTLNVFCSKDLVNWTDCGEIPVAGKLNSKGAAKWSNNSWAPAIAVKKIDGKDKFFLYFADNGNGIGVVTADSPLGPFTDPLGKALISRQTPNTTNVYWLFDPAVFVDDDGTGYLYYGGGTKDDPEHPKSARCVQLGEDMISIVGTPQEIDAPWLFEDSGINKINGKYVYSYCANWTDRAKASNPDECPPCAVIAYMTSDSPLGPFKYTGYTLKNPGSYFGTWGNNHHWMFKFNDRWYIAFHAQTIEKKLGFEKGGYRSIFMDEIVVNADGTLPVQNVKKSGCEQICNFNPFQKVPAATFHNVTKAAVTSTQSVVSLEDGASMLIKNVDLKDGISDIKVTAVNGSKGTIEFCYDKREQPFALVNVDGTETKVEINFPEEAKGVHNMYIKFTGKVEITDWQFN